MKLLLCLLFACFPSYLARTIRIKGRPAFGAPIWTVPGEYPDITLRQGDSLVFVYPASFHDISVVPSSAAFTNCDMSNKITYVYSNGSVASNQPGTSTLNSTTSLVTYIYPAAQIGTFYFVCAVGSHCAGGQKVRVTVVASVAQIPPVQVRVQSLPDVWTVGLAYPNLVINLGDTLEFRSNADHDVSLVSASAFTNCDTSLAAGKLDWPEDALTLATWTPSFAGDFYVICAQAQHCLYGQKFKVTVRTPFATVLPVQATGASVWTIANYPDITVNQNDLVVFSYLKSRHTVALSNSLADYEKCNTSAATIVSSGDGSTNISGSVTVTSARVVYSYSASTPGVFYFICTVSNHCSRGMRFRLNVLPTSGSSQAQVYAATDPMFWTHDVAYPNITISSGQSLMFFGDGFGTHDISLVNQTVYSTKCGSSLLNATTDLLKQLSVTTSTAPYIWTPPPGTHYVICSFGNGFHCFAGMKFVLTVNPTQTITITRSSTETRVFKPPPVASPPVNSAGAVRPALMTLALFIGVLLTNL